MGIRSTEIKRRYAEPTEARGVRRDFSAFSAILGGLRVKSFSVVGGERMQTPPFSQFPALPLHKPDGSSPSS